MSNIKRNPTDNPVIDRIEEALKNNKKTKKEMLSYLGIDASVFSTWRYANGKSYMKYIDKIAEFIGVSVSFLLYGMPDDSTVIQVEPDEMTIIKNYRILDCNKKKIIQELMQAMAQ